MYITNSYGRLFMNAVFTTTIMNNDDIATHIDASHVHDVIHELYLVHRLHYTKQNLGNGHWNSVGNEVSDYRVLQPGTRQKIHSRKIEWLLMLDF